MSARYSIPCEDLRSDQCGRDLVAPVLVITDNPRGATLVDATAGIHVREWEGARRLPSTPGPTQGVFR